MDFKTITMINKHIKVLKKHNNFTCAEHLFKFDAIEEFSLAYLVLASRKNFVSSDSSLLDEFESFAIVINSIFSF